MLLDLASLGSSLHQVTQVRDSVDSDPYRLPSEGRDELAIALEILRLV